MNKAEVINYLHKNLNFSKDSINKLEIYEKMLLKNYKSLNKSLIEYSFINDVSSRNSCMTFGCLFHRVNTIVPVNFFLSIIWACFLLLPWFLPWG